MCGIAGIISKGLDLRGERECIYKISRSLKMRGPDAAGEYVERGAALIHRRLAVIDVKNGAQPMEYLYQGEKYIIVYNAKKKQVGQSIGHACIIWISGV